MRTLMILCLMALLAVVLPAQTPTPYDCQLSATFTASTLTTAPYYNLGPAAPCVSWRLTYNTQNATGVSISLQGTGNLPNGQADPAGWTNLTVTAPVTNPATGTAAGTIAACCDYYPWIRVTAGTFTGAGQTMKLAVFGYKGTSAARTTGGGGGGASGGLILIEQHTASNSPELDFTTCITSSYDSYVLVLSHVENATAAQPMLFQASTNGGSTYDSTSSYQWSNVQVLSNGLAVNNVAFPSTYILLGPSQQDNSPEWGGLSGTFQLPGMSSNMGYVSLTGQTVAKDVRDSEANLRNLGGQYKSTTLVNAFRLIAGSGNISSGTARCYAYAQ